MREYAILDINNLINTWLFNPCQSYIITTSKKKMLTKCQSLTQILVCGFLKVYLHIYPQKLKQKGYVDAVNKNTKT